MSRDHVNDEDDDNDGILDVHDEDDDGDGILDTMDDDYYHEDLWCHLPLSFGHVFQFNPIRLTFPVSC